jgi:hypothetical protein
MIAKNLSNLAKGLLPYAVDTATNASTIQNMDKATDGLDSTATDALVKTLSAAGNYAQVVYDLGAVYDIAISTHVIMWSSTGIARVYIDTGLTSSVGLTTIDYSSVTATQESVGDVFHGAVRRGRYVRLRFYGSAAGDFNAKIKGLAIYKLAKVG